MKRHYLDTPLCTITTFDPRNLGKVCRRDRKSERGLDKTVKELLAAPSADCATKSLALAGRVKYRAFEATVCYLLRPVM